MNVVEVNVKWLREAVLTGLLDGSVNIPHLLLQYYRELKLSDEAAMLLIHLVCFTEKEHKAFPTIEEIQKRMSSEPGIVVSILQKLLKDDFIRIEDGVDPDTGIHFERYNLIPMYDKLARISANQLAEKIERQQLEQAKQNKVKMGSDSDIYSVFEQEFARPLTPMELETITQWLDKDKYSEELIRAALKEAVFSGVVNFRYIDRILLEWSRNRVYTIEQAREYAKQFRNRTENG